jgi:hypothetical protein
LTVLLLYRLRISNSRTMASLQQQGKDTATMTTLEQLAQKIDNDYNSAAVALNLAEEQWEILMVGMFNQFFNILEDGKTLCFQAN